MGIMLTSNNRPCLANIKLLQKINQMNQRERIGEAGKRQSTRIK
jgi:hypothetical protein